MSGQASMLVLRQTDKKERILELDLANLQSIAEIGAGCATVITLVYLAIQIRGSTSASKRAALDEHVDRIGRWMASVRSDQESTSLLIRGNAQFGSFCEDEKFRFHLMLAEFLIYCEAALEHAAADGLKNESAEKTLDHIRRALAGDGAKQWWREYGRKSFASDFSHAVDKLIE